MTATPRKRVGQRKNSNVVMKILTCNLMKKMHRMVIFHQLHYQHKLTQLRSSALEAFVMLDGKIS